MNVDGLRRAQEKMRARGVSDTAIDVFAHHYAQAASGRSGVIRERDIEPMTDPPRLEDAPVSEEEAREALRRTVLIKLNGGLGTSMGLDRAKSLLEVRDGKTFLDIVVAQVRAARARYDARLPLLFMNSFRTREDTLAYLARFGDLAVEGLPVDFVQSEEPKLTADTLEPVEWPADPELEWCPPGHGDVYTSLYAAGLLDALLKHGLRYLNICNGDNLGAAPDARLAGWFASSGAPYAAEVCTRTANDRKGGHLALRRADGQLILRDTAQTVDEEMEFFTDEHRHPYFHTNNLWLDIAALRDRLAERGAVLGLPLITNAKTVDPSDKTSTKVIQLESAMGAAIESFPGATAIAVDRSRFLPVKGTNELLLLRSDVFAMDADARLVQEAAVQPGISLDPDYFKLVDDFERRMVVPPSLREASSLTVHGDWTFDAPVTVRGDGLLEDTGRPERVPAGDLGQG